MKLLKMSVFALMLFFGFLGFAEGGFVFTKFKIDHPNGEWENTTTMKGPGANGKTLKQTVCLDHKTNKKDINAIISALPATPNCNTRILADTAALAKSEQTCLMGARKIVTIGTMKRIDDKSFSYTVEQTPRGVISETVSRYVGACSEKSAKEASENRSCAKCDTTELRKQCKGSPQCDEMANKVEAACKQSCQ